MPLMQRLESGAPRVHLDIHTDDLDAEVARLERLGGNAISAYGAEPADWLRRLAECRSG